MASDILQSIGRKITNSFTGSSTLNQNDASSRQDISSLAIGFLDTSVSILTFALPLFTSVALARNDLGDSLESVFSKSFINTLTLYIAPS